MNKYCPICKGERIKTEYYGTIRNGGLGKYTEKPVEVLRCEDCGVIWHEPLVDTAKYYQSDDYRMSLEDSVDELDFYRLHDKESIDKLQYTGMNFRNRVVADIGCGCGAFLDLVSGVSKDVIAIEPTQKYREVMERKGYKVYPYMSEALNEWEGKVDEVVSFDVIEHVDTPIEFLSQARRLLRTGGRVVIGTPTETPVMRKLLGEVYERKILFSVQHQWVFCEESIKRIAIMAGFKDNEIRIRYFQRYGLTNALGWLNSKEAGSFVPEGIVSETMDRVWKSELESQGISDYLVLYAVR